MGFYTVIQASDEQIQKLYSKHIKKPLVISKSFAYDDEDDIGFVTLVTITGKTVEYQLRGSIPCFVSVTGFGNIRYDINRNIPEPLFSRLQKLGIEVKDRFWKGGQI